MRIMKNEILRAGQNGDRVYSNNKFIESVQSIWKEKLVEAIFRKFHLLLVKVLRLRGETFLSM